MKNLFYFFIVALFIISCTSTSKTIVNNKAKLPEGAVRIANDSLEYEIIIFDTGYDYYLKSIAKPEWYYSLNYLETRNRFYVTEWNIRAQNPLRYNAAIYGNVIDYDFNTKYGFEVNYKLFNYFKFVEYKYKQVF
ncbi:hypothetical protein EC396_07470 [Lutibacter sp. HS1-25]|uniref:DUF6146 family protein n=1 Tax=Lutibacter sp. HS1-25 TaxID=2485000 RepID=UPI001010A410|nr:DUF6146 family protein [Lutibacter sp. HS1-25]RXP56589.1 hypothetical protein EC396_07470 [Lutibacter sp. HS1-25]